MRRAPEFHARLFGVLLRLYPPAFRAEYGAEMTQFFLARMARASERGFSMVVRLWLATVADVMRTALEERRTSVPPHVKRRGSGMMTRLIPELMYAARRLRQSPLFTVSAILILALGIGLNAAAFSMVDALLFRPPPFGEPDRIVHIYEDSDDGDPSATSYPSYRDMAAYSDVFAAVAATSQGLATWESDAGPVPLSIEFATSSYFPVLGLTTARGRWFAAEHDQVGAELVAVVTDHAWRARFGGAEDVIGRVIRLNGQAVTIIGVGPRSFNGEAGALLTDLWLSISSTPVGGPFRVANLDRREDHWYQVKARLAPGVGLEQARSAMAVLALRLGEEFPELQAGRDITVFAHDEVRFHPDVDASLLPAGVGLLTVSGLILLLACSNLANLLLVRGLGRRAEMAVRVALGAGRGTVVRLVVLEALLLAGIGAVAGFALAAWVLRLVPGLPLPIPGGGLDVGVDARVATFGTLLALATALFFGLVPALRSTRGDIAAALRDEGRGRTAGPGVQLLHGGLVAVQVAASVVLIVGAGLLARSLASAAAVDIGVDTDRIAVIGTNFQQAGVADGEAGVIATALLERVRAIPGVEAAALTTRLPLQPAGTTTQIVDGHEPRAGTGSVELPFAVVSRDYFETMGMRLIDGRSFAAEDRPDTRRVVLVNETAARMYWDGAAVGGRIRAQSVPDAWREVVGVVTDAKVSSLGEPPTPMVYYSAEQAGVGGFSIVARTGGDPKGLLSPLRTALSDVRPSLPVTRLAVLADVLRESLAGARLAASLMAAFSVLALLLASLGVYAVVSFNVQRRAPELGIRAALGAARTRLVTTVLGQSLLAVVVGIAAGLWLATLATRALEGMLLGVSPLDLATFATAALLLIAAATAAAFLPALRAARADPLDVLRG